jgi:hypothetical protein
MNPLNEIVLWLGALVDWLIAVLFHGALWNETSIKMIGNTFQAYALLRRRGIYARSSLPRIRDGKIGVIDVKRKQKQLAMLVLRKNGYECW